MATVVIPSICFACKHFNQSIWGLNTDEPQTCDAYPDGIPARYLRGGMAHTDPDGDDQGITFELNPAKSGALDTFIQFWYEPDPGTPPEESGGSRLEINT